MDDAIVNLSLLPPLNRCK